LILLQDIKYLANAYTVFEHIQYQDKKKEVHKLMQIVEEGKIYLYREVIINRGVSTGNYTPFVAPTITYVVKKGGQTYLIEKSNFNQVLLTLIDLPELRSLIENKLLKYSDLEEIIKQYNIIQAKS
jgi:hypothetical protein